MYTGITHLHNILRWGVLIFLLLAVLIAIIGIANKSNKTSQLKKISLFALIFTHVSLVTGLILYFISPILISYRKLPMADLMKNEVTRYWTVEHLVGNLIAIILITLGYSLSKRAKTDRAKFLRILIFFSLGLILLLSNIPWPWKAEGIARGLFPGM
jgi:uncharacterized membrane protein (DUF485 family)